MIGKQIMKFATKSLAGIIAVLAVIVLSLGTITPTQPVSAETGTPVYSDNEQAEYGLTINGIHVKIDNSRGTEMSFSAYLENTGADITDPFQTSFYLNDVLKETKTKTYSEDSVLETGEEILVRSLITHTLQEGAHKIKIMTDEYEDIFSEYVYVPHEFPTINLDTITLEQGERENVDEDLVLSINSISNSRVAISYEFLNKDYKYTGTSYDLAEGQSFIIANGKHTYRIKADEIGDKVKLNVYRDAYTSDGNGGSNPDTPEEEDPDTPDNTIYVYTGKSFSLVERQTAVLADYKPVRITLNDIEHGILPEVHHNIAKITINYNYEPTAGAPDGITGFSISLKKGETREAYGLYIKLVDIDNEKATFLITKKTYLPSYVDIGVEPRIRTVNNGEATTYAITVKDNHPVTRCIAPVAIVNPELMLGTYTLKEEEVKEIDNAFKIEVVEITEDKVYLLYSIRGTEDWEGYVGKQELKSWEDFYIKTPEASYRIKYLGWLSKLVGEVTVDTTTADTTSPTEIRPSEEPIYAALSVYKTKITETPRCIAEDKQYSYELSIIGLPFAKTYAQKITLNAGEKKTFKLVVDTSKQIVTEVVEAEIVSDTAVDDSTTADAEGAPGVSAGGGAAISTAVAVKEDCINRYDTTAEYESCVTTGSTGISAVAPDQVIAPYYKTYKFAVKVIGDDAKDVAYATLNVKQGVETPSHTAKIWLDQGWNLVSTSGSRLVEFARSTCEKKLNAYVYVKEKERYYTLPEAERLLGEDFKDYLVSNAFWVYSFQDCSLEILLERGALTELNLKEGWNLVPITEEMFGKTLKEITSNCEIEKTYGFDSENQEWDRIDSSYVFSTEDQYKGIIMKVSNYCEFGGIDISNPPDFPE
jgi:hypothetical protein